MTAEGRNIWGKKVFLLLISLLLVALYHFSLASRAIVELDIDTDTRTVLKVYWPRDDGRYTEKRMARITIVPGKSQYHLRICQLKGLRMLRLDPGERPARILLRSITIIRQGAPPLKYSVGNAGEIITPLQGIANFEPGQDGWRITVSGNDPQLAIPLPERVRKTSILAQLLRLTWIPLLVYLLAWLLKPAWHASWHVVCMLVFSLALILVMASVSAYNHHPDEYVHVNAARYYVHHTLPPRIGAPEIRHTYSIYGVSRLHSGEIVYVLAGKFLWLLQPLHLPAYRLLRYFNVSLFLLLLLFAIRRVAFRIFLLPMLISAQTWYVFSYFNSDALALTISLLTAYQMAAPGSALRQYLEKGVDAKTWWRPLAVGLLLALLLLLKKNFYFFYVFLFLYTCWEILFGDWSLTRTFVIRFFAVLAVAVCLAGLYRGTDYWINGPDRNTKLLQVRDKLARRMYKPSTPLAHRHPYLQMKERGIPLSALLGQYRWGEKSFRSAFGVYDYLSLSGPFRYYDLVRYTGILFLAAMLFPVLLRGGPGGISLLAISSAVSLALMVTALYHAWSVDFQAQGRYFLPVLAIFAPYLYHERGLIFRPAFWILAACMYLLAVYSFVFVGIAAIAKVAT